jgi:hypothetical protein
VRICRVVVPLLACVASVFAPARAVATPAWRPLLEPSGLTPGGGDLSVTLSARAEQSDVRAGMSGFVALVVPLDRLAAPRKLAAGADERLDEDAHAVAPGEARAAEAERASPETPEEPAISAPVLARLARAAVAAALRAHDVSLRRSELEGLATRARVSAALPELRFRAAHSNDQSLRLAPTLEDPDRYTLDGGNDLMLEASATWRLNRLVFADEEIAVERLVLERERNTEKLSARVLERLFDWHRALSGIPSADPKVRAKLELERIEAEVELDGLTGGWFGAEAERFRSPRPGRNVYKSDDSTSSSVTSPSSMSTLPTPSQ